MQHITDEQIDRLVSPEDAQQAMFEAFSSFGEQRAAMQERIRTEAGGIKLSTLGAVIPDLQVAGAKVYTTINGQFSFVILLFSTEDGRPLASFDAAAITRLRTAACSVIAARHLVGRVPATLAILGAGAQGLAHARQMTAAFPLRRIKVFSPGVDSGRTEQLARCCGIPVEFVGADEAVVDADIVVTASRSATPLFAGASLKPGAFVAAVGSSLPHTRELDDDALARAVAVVVEWRPQSLREAGDIVLRASHVRDDDKIVELADVVTGKVRPRCNDDDIVIYKSVGVGLQDVALAGLAFRRVMGERLGGSREA